MEGRGLTQGFILLGGGSQYVKYIGTRGSGGLPGKILNLKTFPHKMHLFCLLIFYIIPPKD